MHASLCSFNCVPSLPLVSPIYTKRNELVGVVYRFNALRSEVSISAVVQYVVDSNSSVFVMALYRYFTVGSVPTRVSKELKEANMIVHGGCVLVTFGHVARHLTCIM